MIMDDSKRERFRYDREKTFLHKYIANHCENTVIMNSRPMSKKNWQNQD